MGTSKLRAGIYKKIHPSKTSKNIERSAEEQRQRVAAAAAHALEMARIQEEQQLAHIAAVMLAAKAEIESWYAAEFAKSQEQYAQSHNDYVESLDDVQQSQDNSTQELTEEHTTQIATLIQNQQADEEYLEQCYTLLSEMLNELQEYAKAESTQIQLNTVDIIECSELVEELNQVLQEHDIDCLDTPQTNITVAEAIEVITAIQGNLAIAQQELHSQYELAILELNAEFEQKLLDSKDMHEQMLAQVEAQWLEYQNNHAAYVTSLGEYRDAQLSDINNQELQEIAKVEAAYQAHVVAINAEMQLRIKQINDNLLAQAEHLKRSAQAFMIAAVTMVAAGVVAYFSAGLLAGFSAHIINFVRTTLAVTSLRAAERLANGQGGVSVDVSANLAPQPKPYTPPPVVQPKLNTKVAIENSEQKVTAVKNNKVKSDKPVVDAQNKIININPIPKEPQYPKENLANSLLIGSGRFFVETGQGIKQFSMQCGAEMGFVDQEKVAQYTQHINKERDLYDRSTAGSKDFKVGEFGAATLVYAFVPAGSGLRGYKLATAAAANGALIAGTAPVYNGSWETRGQNAAVGAAASAVIAPIAPVVGAITTKVVTGATKTASNFMPAVTFQYI